MNARCWYTTWPKRVLSVLVGGEHELLLGAVDPDVVLVCFDIGDRFCSRHSDRRVFPEPHDAAENEVVFAEREGVTVEEEPVLTRASNEIAERFLEKRSCAHRPACRGRSEANWPLRLVRTSSTQPHASTRASDNSHRMVVPFIVGIATYASSSLKSTWAARWPRGSAGQKCLQNGAVDYVQSSDPMNPRWGFDRVSARAILQ